MTNQPVWDYDALEATYRTVAMQLISTREAHREYDETLTMLRHVIRMQDEVQAGSNEKARQALYENALAGNEGYQEHRLEVLRLARAVADGEVEELIARRRMDYLIATAGA